MIYKTVKHPELEYSYELESFVYKGKKIPKKEVTEIRYKWAKVDLVNAAKDDAELKPEVKFKVFEIIVNNMSPSDLTTKKQAITYHAIKRYVACIFECFDLVVRNSEEMLPKVELKTPTLKNSENPRSLVSYAGNSLVYKGRVYNYMGEQQDIIFALRHAEICKYATIDDQIKFALDGFALPFISNLIDVVVVNNQMVARGVMVYKMLKSIIIGLDLDFKCKPKVGMNVQLMKNSLTDIDHYRLG